jgi:hypothetical protein
MGISEELTCLKSCVVVGHHLICLNLTSKDMRGGGGGEPKNAGALQTEHKFIYLHHHSPAVGRKTSCVVVLLGVAGSCSPPEAREHLRNTVNLMGASDPPPVGYCIFWVISSFGYRLWYRPVLPVVPVPETAGSDI